MLNFLFYAFVLCLPVAILLSKLKWFRCHAYDMIHVL